MPTSPETRTTETVFDTAVLGAGPAGLAAAVAAAEAGATVALLDAGPRIGGQYWRHRDGDDGRHHSGWPEFVALRSAVLRRPDLIEHFAAHAVWQVETLPDNDFRVNAVVGDDERVVRARTVVVATGAYDRQLPFPGWTLPGVLTAGGAQALLKGHGVVAGSRIVVAGTGVFLPAVAAGLAQAGATVLGVHEASGVPTAFARHPLAVVGNAGKLREGTHYAAVLARHRIPYRTRSAVIAARGEDTLTSVTVARLDQSWKVVEGSQRDIECDTLAVGYGFTPQLELLVQLGGATRLDEDGSLVAVVDEQQRASIPGVFVAGETTGVGGSTLSVTEGTIAGMNAAHASGRTAPDIRRLRKLFRRRAVQRRFASTLPAAYPVRPGWMTWTNGDTIVCRCEEVTVRTIDQAIAELGAADPRAVKLYARPGMGLCQGRVCGYATSALVADRAGRSIDATDLQGVAGRPIAAPITLSQLAAAHRRNLQSTETSTDQP